MITRFYSTGAVYVVMYSLLWLASLLIFLKVKRKFGIGGFLISAYFLSSIGTIMFLDGVIKGELPQRINYNQFSAYSFIYLFACIIICMLPFIIHSNDLLSLKCKIDISKNEFLKKFLQLCAPIILIGFISILHAAINVNVSTLADTYEDTVTGGNDALQNINFIGRKAIIFTSLIDLLWPILFYICLSSKCYKLSIIPLFAILSLILMSYVCAARVGVFKTVLYFFIIYFFFRGNLPSKVKQCMNIILVFSLALVGLVLAYITISRFSDTDSSISSWIALYVGEGPIRFADNLWKLNKTCDGDMCFSLLKEILGLDPVTDLTERRYIYQNRLGIPVSIFYTFIGNIYLDLNKIGTLLFCLFVSIVMNRIIKSTALTKSLSLTKLFVLSYSILTLAFGFTYLSFTTYSSQVNLVRCFVVILILDKICSKSKSKRFL